MYKLHKPDITKCRDKRIAEAIFREANQLLDVFATALNVVAHEDTEEVVGCASVIHANSQERAVGGVECRITELFGIHFAEALEACQL